MVCWLKMSVAGYSVTVQHNLLQYCGGESNESVYERCRVGSQANGVNCGVLVKRNTLRWSGHIERMGSEELLKKVYISESVG